MRNQSGHNNPNYKGGAVELTCAVCGKTFFKSRGSYNHAVKRNKSNTFTCSRTCADKNKGHIVWRDCRVNMICEYCGKTFKTWESQRLHKHKFCSKECAIQFTSKQRIVERLEEVCINCGSTFKRTQRYLSLYKKHFCSLKCQHEYSKGVNSSNWKGGITPLSVRVRNVKEAIAWVKAIKLRDNNTCVKCGSMKDIHVHHKEELVNLLKKYNVTTVIQAKNIPELWNINNGECVCKTCHAEEHPKQKKFILKTAV